MPICLTVLLVFFIVVLLWIYGIYASLIIKRNKTQKAFLAIDSQLRKKYEFLPQILNSAKKYMETEHTFLQEVVDLRNLLIEIPSSYEFVDRIIALENEITQNMKQIISYREKYPQINSDEALTNLFKIYTDAEKKLTALKHTYNSLALKLRQAVEVFPTSLMARFVNIKSADSFRV